LRAIEVGSNAEKKNNPRVMGNNTRSPLITTGGFLIFLIPLGFTLTEY
jgi:hypothetical protein